MNIFPYLTPASDGQIDIGVPEPLPPDHQMPPGVRVTVFKNFDPELDSAEVDGIPVTSPERTITDLADTCSPLEIASFIERAAAMGNFDVDRFEETYRRVQHERGTWVAQRALELWRQNAIAV